MRDIVNTNKIVEKAMSCEREITADSEASAKFEFAN